MKSPLTPMRRRGVEILDDRAVPDDVRRRAMQDVTRSNKYFGGTRSALEGLRDALQDLPSQAVLLDVGTGMADILTYAQREAQRARIALTTVGLDISEPLVRLARSQLRGGVVADALRIPLADGSVDVVICSQVLHHFIEPDARQVIAELHRVSRRWVVISDLHRSWVAAGGFWLASGLLGFHEVTRLDGVTSVFRGFTSAELRALVQNVTGVAPRIRRGAFWRLSATWKV